MPNAKKDSMFLEKFCFRKQSMMYIGAHFKKKNLKRGAKSTKLFACGSRAGRTHLAPCSARRQTVCFDESVIDDPRIETLTLSPLPVGL